MAKKGKAYQKQMMEHRALEDVVKNCSNLSEGARKEILEKMDLWKRGAIEGNVEDLMRLGHEFLGQN